MTTDHSVNETRLVALSREDARPTLQTFLETIYYGDQSMEADALLTSLDETDLTLAFRIRL